MLLTLRSNLFLIKGTSTQWNLAWYHYCEQQPSHVSTPIIVGSFTNCHTSSFWSSKNQSQWLVSEGQLKEPISFKTQAVHVRNLKKPQELTVPIYIQLLHHRHKKDCDCNPQFITVTSYIVLVWAGIQLISSQQLVQCCPLDLV